MWACSSRPWAWRATAPAWGRRASIPTTAKPQPHPDGGWSAIFITPTQVMLDSQNGAKPTQQFSVTGQRPDGTMSGPLAATYSVPPNGIGTIDPNTGVFTATGEVGGNRRCHGHGHQQWRFGHGHDADHRQHLQGHRDPGHPSNAATRFTGTPVANAAKSANLVYPLDGVVMPQNVFRRISSGRTAPPATCIASPSPSRTSRWSSTPCTAAPASSSTTCRTPRPGLAWRRPASIVMQC